MKTETPKKKHNLTDRDRDQVLKLLVCGLPTKEIAEIMHISTSSVSYIRQAHTACMNKDWDILCRLYKDSRTLVEWALKATGTEKEFAEMFTSEPIPEVEAPKPEPVPETPTREDFYAMYATLQDIRSLLTDIRDMLK